MQIAVRRPASAASSEGGPLRVSVSVVANCAASARDIRVYQVLDVPHVKPAAHPVFAVPVRNAGWIPDLCLPLASGGAAEAQAHRPDELTLLVDVGDVPAGHVRIRVAPLGQDAPPAELDLEIRHWQAQIPRRLPFVTGVTWNWQLEKYLGRQLTAAERRAFLDFFLDFRLTPAAFFAKGPSLSDDELLHVVERGGNLIQLCQLGGGGKRRLSDRAKAELEPRLKTWRQQLQAAGALGDAYALIADEPDAEAIPVIIENARWLTSVFPELRIWVASRPIPELLEVVDVWDMVTAHSTDVYARHSFTGESLALARGAPRHPQVWWFHSVEPYAPHANVRLDDDLADARATGWASFAAGVDGYEYFWATDWSMNAGIRDVPYPARAALWDPGLAGAGQLCYPGPDGLPVPSLRLFGLRDAMEEWALCLQAPAVARQQGAPRDPVRLQEARRRVLAEIEVQTGR